MKHWIKAAFTVRNCFQTAVTRWAAFQTAFSFCRKKEKSDIILHKAMVWATTRHWVCLKTRIWICGLDLTMASIASTYSRLLKSFSDDTGFIGTVYASSLFNGNLYIGTNSGIVLETLRDQCTIAIYSEYKRSGLVVVSIRMGNYFCGHDSGTFLITGNSADKIFASSGTWKFETVPNHPELLLQGNYYGLSVFEKNQMEIGFFATKSAVLTILHDTLSPRKMVIFSSAMSIKGFSKSIPIWICEQQKKCWPTPNPVKGKNAGLAQFNGNIYYTSKERCFQTRSCVFKI